MRDRIRSERQRRIRIRGLGIRTTLPATSHFSATHVLKERERERRLFSLADRGINLFSPKYKFLSASHLFYFVRYHRVTLKREKNLVNRCSRFRTDLYPIVIVKNHVSPDHKTCLSVFSLSLSSISSIPNEFQTAEPKQRGRYGEVIHEGYARRISERAEGQSSDGVSRVHLSMQRIPRKG